MNCVYTRQFQLMIVIININKNDISDLQARTKQFARIHTRSLINIEKILNRPIAKFYNSDDVNVIELQQSYGSLKQGELLFIRNNVLLETIPTYVNKILKVNVKNRSACMGYYKLKKCPYRYLETD